MSKLKINLTLVALVCAALFACACGSDSATRADSTRRAAAPSLPPAAPLNSDDRASEVAIRSLEERVRRDPEDHAAHNRLAGFYLQRARETGNAEYINLAARAARASLASVPELRNAGGLAALAEAELASHDFVAARDHAVQLIELDPGKSYPFGILCDAQLELGAYTEAASAIQRMERAGGGINSGSEIRMARLSTLHGDMPGAQRHLSNALALALNLPAPSRETVAWCRWQLGETSFAVGDYETAERHYRDALTTFPDYYRALASMGRVRAARGDVAGAIEHYEHIVSRLPDPVFFATLGDLYRVAGREPEAAAQYRLVEQIARLNAVNGALYNRQLALFYADHDMNTEEAYRLAAREYEVRRDIYGADALAWTALKAGRIAEAQTAMREALRLGTRDARLFYHAGMIARAAGDQDAARAYINRALALNPQFDSLQASIATRAVNE